MEIDAWSDIACPWCFVGKRRFEAALERFEHRDEVTVTWHAFELDPHAPAERPGRHAEHLAAKYGMAVEQADAAHARMTEAGAEDGIAFDFERVRGGNTFDGHRLIQLADAHGKQGEMKDRLQRAYFEEGELISDHATLRRLAGEVGLPGDQVAALLEGDALTEEVRTDEGTAQAIGIRGVPFFVADRRYGLSGAQPPDVLLEFLREAWRRGRAAAA